MFEARHELELVVVHWAAERRIKSDLKKMEIALKKMGETID